MAKNHLTSYMDAPLGNVHLLRKAPLGTFYHWFQSNSHLHAKNIYIISAMFFSYKNTRRVKGGLLRIAKLWFPHSQQNQEDCSNFQNIRAFHLRSRNFLPKAESEINCLCRSLFIYLFFKMDVISKNLRPCFRKFVSA